MPEELRRQIEWTTREYQLKLERQKLWRRAMVDDQAVKEWVDDICGMGETPTAIAIVRAATYGNSGIDPWQELNWPSYANADERRPVIMRGTRYVMVAKRSGGSGGGRCANNFCAELLYRYLRAIRYTSDDARKSMEFIYKIARRIKNKGRYYLTYHFWREEYFGYWESKGRYSHVWKGGERIQNPQLDEPPSPVLRVERKKLTNIERSIGEQYAKPYYSRKGRRQRAVIRAIQELGLLNEEELI